KDQSRRTSCTQTPIPSRRAVVATWFRHRTGTAGAWSSPSRTAFRLQRVPPLDRWFDTAVLDAIGGLLGGVGHLTLWRCDDDAHWSLPLVSWLFLGLPPVAQLLNLIRHCNDVV